MKNELISYIIPIWEKSSTRSIELSIKSLESEDFLIGEILIVFDGYDSFNKQFSIPNTFRNKIKYIYCGINKGPGIARNKGVLFSKNKYIFFLDCGDQSLKNRAVIQLKILDKYDVSFGNISEISPTGKEFIRRGASSYMKARKLIAFRNPFNNVTMAIKKNTFIELGGYANLRVAEDWVLMGKIIKKELKISSLDKSLVKVFIGQDFLRRRSGNKFFDDIRKCLITLLKLKLMNKTTFLISLIIQFIIRRLLPLKILSLIYKFLRK